MSFHNKTETWFNALGGNSFLGLGTTVRLLHSNSEPNINTNFSSTLYKFARVLMSTTDPGTDPINDYTSFFSNASYANTTNSFLTALGTATIIVSFVPPASWCTPSPSAGEAGILTGPEIALYANYVADGLTWLISFASAANVQYLEVFNEPDAVNDSNPHMTIDDFYILVDQLRALVPSTIKLLGPNTLSFLSTNSNSTTDPYLSPASRLTFDTFAIHGHEHINDTTLTNAGDFTARSILFHEGIKNMLVFNSINNTAQKLVTSFSTIATSYLPGQIDAGTLAPLTNDFAIRCIENLCHILNAGFHAAIFDNLTSTNTLLNGHRSLYTAGGTPNPIHTIFTAIASRITFPVNVFRPEILNKADMTIKTALVTPNDNAFLFILCRSFLPDALDGYLSLVLENTAWNPGFVITNLQLTCFPTGTGIDITTTIVRAELFESRLEIGISGLPLQASCILLVSGTVTIPPSSAGPLVPVYVSVPSSSSVPTTNSTFDDGTVYYNVINKTLYTSINNTWVATTPLS